MDNLVLFLISVGFLGVFLPAIQVEEVNRGKERSPSCPDTALQGSILPSEVPLGTLPWASSCHLGGQLSGDRGKSTLLFWVVEAKFQFRSCPSLIIAHLSWRGRPILKLNLGSCPSICPQFSLFPIVTWPLAAQWLCLVRMQPATRGQWRRLQVSFREFRDGMWRYPFG